MLNNTKIKRLKPKEKPYRELDADNLYIEVRPSGAKFWRYRYKKIDGKYSMISLGEFPDVDIDEARQLRDQHKRKEHYGDAVFKEVAADWLVYKSYKSEKNRKLIERRIEQHLLPKLGNMPIADIRPKDVLPILKHIEKQGYLELARRVQNIASQIFKYAIQNLLCETNPAQVLQGATKKPEITPMAAVVDEDGFRHVLKSIDAADHLSIGVRLCLQVAPYVFLRSESIRIASPEHIDFKNKVWLIPKDKMQREHLIPLTDSVIDLLQQALEFTDGEFLFIGGRKGRPISENTLNVALRSLGIDNHVFHGFRSSFSTLAREKLRLNSDLIELQLGHIEKNKVKAAYDRSDRLEERFELMQSWADYVDTLKAH